MPLFGKGKKSKKKQKKTKTKKSLWLSYFNIKQKHVKKDEQQLLDKRMKSQSFHNRKRTMSKIGLDLIDELRKDTEDFDEYSINEKAQIAKQLSINIDNLITKQDTKLEFETIVLKPEKSKKDEIELEYGDESDKEVGEGPFEMKIPKFDIEISKEGFVGFEKLVKKKKGNLEVEVESKIGMGVEAKGTASLSEEGLEVSVEGSVTVGVTITAKGNYERKSTGVGVCTDVEMNVLIGGQADALFGLKITREQLELAASAGAFLGVQGEAKGNVNFTIWGVPVAGVSAKIGGGIGLGAEGSAELKLDWLQGEFSGSLSASTTIGVGGKFGLGGNIKTINTICVLAEIPKRVYAGRKAKGYKSLDTQNEIIAKKSKKIEKLITTGLKKLEQFKE